MDTLGAFLGVFGLLALVIGLIMFIPIAALKARRPLTKWLAIGGAVAFAVGLILSPTVPPDKPQPHIVAQPTAPKPAVHTVNDARKSQVPAAVINDNYLRIVNVSLPLTSTTMEKGDLAAIAQAIKNMGRLEGSPWKNAEAINIEVRGSDRRMLMHMTLPGDAFRQATREDQIAGFFLMLGREVGFNEIAAERAAREYCAGTSNPFCDQVS
jgi:hypothetical protein